MKKVQEKGFALVLSLVLLLVKNDELPGMFHLREAMIKVRTQDAW